MTDSLALITEMADAGATVSAMCAATGLRPSRVYQVLREHRPDRPRQPRTATSTVPDKARALAATGARPVRIAALLGISTAYVYRILGE